MTTTVKYLFCAAIAASPLMAHATNYAYDTNQGAAGYGVTNGDSFNWQGANSWNTDLAGGAGTYVTWNSTASPQADDSVFVNDLGTGTGYTVTLGASDNQTINIGDLGLNWNLSNSTALGSGDVTIGGAGGTGSLVTRATAQLGSASGTLTINSALKFGSSSFGMTFRGGNVVINGVISDLSPALPANVPFLFQAANGLTGGTLTLANVANTYAGRTSASTIASNYVLEVTKLANGNQTSSIGTSSAAIGINGGTLRFIGAGAQSTNLGLYLGSVGGIVDASGATAADTIAFSGAISYSGANSTRALTLTGNNTGNNTLALDYGNNGTGNNTLTKNGTGKWVLAGNNSYTGTTTINAGSLLINGNQTSANGGVFVNNGGTLGGTGTIGGATTIRGILAPGDGVGTLNIANNVTWNATASAGDSTDWEFDLAAGNTADLLNITGNFLKTGTGVFRFDFLGSTEIGIFKLVDWTGTTNFSVGDFSYTNLGAGNTGNFAFNGSQLELTVSAIPEPSTWGLIGASLLVLLTFRRRRQS